MGAEIDSASFSREDFQAFAARLKEETELFKTWWKQGVLADEPARIGLELEAWLVDAHGRPAPVNEAVLSRRQDPLLAPELAQYNVELNSTPRPLAGYSLSALAAELSSVWTATNEAAAEVDARLAMTGILPSVRQEDLSLDRMSHLHRYQALNEQVLLLRNQRPLSLDIEGEDSLHLQQSDVMLESAATALQLHLQTSPSDAPRFFNAAVMASAATVAIAANSPYLFGRRLWMETRIPLFEQAVAVAPPHGGHAGPFGRVGFGSAYGRDALYQFFVENRQHYPVLLPVRLNEPMERLPHLRLHNGTIWRWNRPVVGFNEDGQPHLRIEHRVMAAGPTIVDTAANAAFFYGIVHGLAASDEAVHARLPFTTAERNFYEAARHGLAAQVDWFGGSRLDLQTLLLDTLLPLARRGLSLAGVDDGDADSYLGIIERRVAGARTGADWQRAWIDRHGPDFDGMVAAYIERQEAGDPVHDWPL